MKGGFHEVLDGERTVVVSPVRILVVVVAMVVGVFIVPLAVDFADFVGKTSLPAVMVVRDERSG